YQSRQCDKNFGQSSFLINNVRLHTGEKQFQCDKAFGNNSYLIEHTRTHTGEKHFQLCKCNKDFTKYCHLTSHMILHTGEKPLQCSQFDKYLGQKFSYNAYEDTLSRNYFNAANVARLSQKYYHLTIHISIHTG
ncbi:unnamed protein product, partial [Meganyctiphanes norvegica]